MVAIPKMSTLTRLPQPSIRVLIVEDSPAHAYLQRRLLGAGCESSTLAIVQASTLEEACRHLAAGAFQIILLDLMLPDSRGMDTLDAVRDAAGDAAIIVLTSLHDEDAALEALAHGAQDYLFKSELEPRLLRRTLRYALERRRAAAERNELQRLQATVDSLLTEVAVLDRAGTIVLVNESWRAFAAANGYPDATAGVGTNYVQVSEAANDDNARELAEAIREVTAGRLDSWTGEYPCHGPDEERYFAVRVAPCRDARLAVVVTHDNVTAEKRTERQRRAAERALQESVERFHMVARATKDIIWDWDLRTGALVWNEGISTTMGYPAHEVDPEIGWWRERIHPDDVARVYDGLDAALASAENWSAEYRLRRADGSYAVILDRGVIQRGAGGVAMRMIGSMQDVTEHRRLVEAIERSESHYRRLVTGAPQTIFALDVEGTFVELNPAGTQLLGREAGDILGRHFSEVVPLEDRAAAESALWQLLSGSPVQVELCIVRASGEARIIHVDAIPIRSGGLPAGTHGIARDITDERAREKRMRLLSAALENLSESVIILDAAGLIVYANPGHGRMLGYDHTSPPREGVFAFTPDAEDAQTVVHAIERTCRDGSWSGRMRRRCTDGRIIPVQVRMERIVGEGRPLIFSIGRDVTDELEQEQRLRRAERLASVGTLIGGVAHELNNPLAAIVGFAQLLLMDERPAADREDLDTIRREAERMAKIVSDLRLIARNTQEETRTTERVDLNEALRHVLRTRGYSLRTANVEVREELDPELPPVLGDGGQLEQVLLNLVVNAEQALEECAGPRCLTLRTHGGAAGVSVHVVDSGPGIAPEHLEHLFDPFFTTKPPGQGTGLGLSLVHRIVAEHGGEIHVESRAGVETCFRIDLPTAPAEDPREEPELERAAASRPLRVLVVDDEEAVRHALSRFLVRSGHTVDEAADGMRALALLDADPAGYDVILSDLRMPGLGGAELLARLREGGRGEDRRLVFLTGDTASEYATRILGEVDVPVLTKPVDLKSVARVVEEMAAR